MPVTIWAATRDGSVARAVRRREPHDRQHGEQRGPERDQEVGADPGRVIVDLALDPDDARRGPPRSAAARRDRVRWRGRTPWDGQSTARAPPSRRPRRRPRGGRTRSAGRHVQVDAERAAADRDALEPHRRGIEDHRPRPARAERRDGVALVAGDRARLLGVGEGQPPDPEMGAQPRPVEAAAGRHEDEQVVVVATTHDDRPQQRAQRDALERRRLSSALPARSVRTTSCGSPDASTASMAGVAGVSAIRRRRAGRRARCGCAC